MAAIDLDLMDRICNDVHAGRRTWPTGWAKLRPRFDVLMFTAGDFDPEREPNTGGDTTDAPRRTIADASDAQLNMIRSLLADVPADHTGHAVDLTKLSKKAATKLIDELKLDAIRKPTEGQWSFLDSLVSNRDPNGELTKILQALKDDPDTSFELVSATINAVKVMPVVATPTDTTLGTDAALWDELAGSLADLGGQHGARFAVDTEDGASNKLAFWVVVRRGTRIFLNQYIGGSGAVRVRMSRPAQLAVVKKIHAAGPRDAMIRFGHELGVCGRCGTELTDDTSRANGMGPVCIDK